MKKGKVSNSEFEKMERVYSNNSNHIENKFYLYYSYTMRIIVMFMIIVFLGAITFLCFKKSFSDSSDISLAYEEKDDLEYKVSLLENNPFQEGTLEPNGSYISDLIDNISADLFYKYKFDEDVDIKYSYYVDVNMVLRDKNTNSEISNKTYPLMEKIEKEEKNIKEINIDQNINLDYNYYNNMAKGIDDNYNLDLSGNLYLKMYIDTNVNYKGFDDVIKKIDVVEVKIPLLSSQVEIVKTSDLNKKDVYIKHINPELENEGALYIGVVLLILDTILLLMTLTFIYRSTPKKSRYRKVRDGLLREYNSKIVNSKNMPVLKEYNVIVCTSFSELLDAQRLLDKPIIYYEIVKDQKCVFVILGTNDAYKFTLKKCDIEYS